MYIAEMRWIALAVANPFSIFVLEEAPSEERHSQ